MSTRVTIDPVTRIEGHLRIDLEVDGGRVKNAWSSGTMWRGIETILRGRDARDGWIYSQRFCGVCTTVHAIASVRAVENALKLEVPLNSQYIRNLILKARMQGHHRLDQTLLLRGLADALRGPNQLGSFASDSLMKLGLLGTIIGFILMLAPIAGLDSADHASVKSSMVLMSDGMAVAMYTTLTGLIGSVLVQAQYFLLDESTAKVFALATDTTEVFVVSVLEREKNG